MRRFPPPWTVETIPGGLKVVDANGQSLAYVYSRETKDAAQIAKVLTEDEATSHSQQHRQAANLAWPELIASASVGAPVRQQEARDKNSSVEASVKGWGPKSLARPPTLCAMTIMLQKLGTPRSPAHLPTNPESPVERPELAWPKGHWVVVNNVARRG
jgi:hypothetical protein